MATPEHLSEHLADALRRLDILERRNRRLRLAGMALVAVTAGIAARSVSSEPAATRTTAKAPLGDLRVETVTANRFVTVNAEGRTRAEMKDGVLVFYADDGTKRLELGTARGTCPAQPAEETTGALFNFFDVNGKQRVGFSSSENGWSTLSFHGADGAGCARINVSDQCRSELVVGNYDGGTGRIWQDETGQANFDLLDGQKIRWTTRTPPD